MEHILQTYNFHCKNTSYINEHLPTLARYASGCESVIKLGVRGCISSWAFMVGLKNNNRQIKKLFLHLFSFKTPILYENL